MNALADVRVLAIEQFGAGPFGSLHLADLGAEVIKIEDPATGGDVSRSVTPFAGEDDSIFFQAFNRGKRSVCLDLRNESGWEVFTRLVARSDAVFANLRADAAARLGLRHERLREFNPRIVCANLSAFGEGSRAREPGYDYVLQAEAGWMSITGEPEGPPTKSGLSVVDYAAGVVAALSLLAAIHAARRDGVGRDCDLSLYDTAVSMLSYPAAWYLHGGLEPERTRRSSHPSIVPFGAFEAADGWLVVACAKEHFWQKLAVALGREDLGRDPRFETMEARRRNRGELIPILDDAFAARPVESWIAGLREHGVPCAAVRTVAEALKDPFCAERGMLVEVDHPGFGEISLPSTAARVTGTTAGDRPGPALGGDTRAVLDEMLDLDEDGVADLARRGAFGS